MTNNVDVTNFDGRNFRLGIGVNVSNLAFPIHVMCDGESKKISIYICLLTMYSEVFKDWEVYINFFSIVINEDLV